VTFRHLRGIVLLEWTDPAGVRRLDGLRPCTLYRAAGVVDTLRSEGWRVDLMRVDSELVQVRATISLHHPFR
jgi:hypothetical protein